MAGFFNCLGSLRLGKNTRAIVQWGAASYLGYLEEKIDAEVATMRHLSRESSLAIPKILYYSKTANNPPGIGPLLVMETVDCDADLEYMLSYYSRRITTPMKIDYTLPDDRLRDYYGQLADFLLVLYNSRHDSIGALGDPDANGNAQVRSRPFSFNSMYHTDWAWVPDASTLPGGLGPDNGRFKTSEAYYKDIADLQLLQLSYQRSNIVQDREDCRKKYLARQLFRKLARESRLHVSEYNNGPFPLFSDGLNPGRALVVGTTISGIPDWSYTYAAPMDFSVSPPWWLLVCAPEDWPRGLKDWEKHYKPKLEVFLKVLETKERRMSRGMVDKPTESLSSRMRISWDSGHFWVTYAARTPWAFDKVYWEYVDPRFYPERDPKYWKERIKFLTPTQVNYMETLVERKMKEKQQGGLEDLAVTGVASLGSLPLDLRVLDRYDVVDVDLRRVNEMGTPALAYLSPQTPPPAASKRAQKRRCLQSAKVSLTPATSSQTSKPQGPSSIRPSPFPVPIAPGPMKNKPADVKATETPSWMTFGQTPTNTTSGLMNQRQASVKTTETPSWMTSNQLPTNTASSFGQTLNGYQGVPQTPSMVPALPSTTGLGPPYSSMGFSLPSAPSSHLASASPSGGFSPFTSNSTASFDDGASTNMFDSSPKSSSAYTPSTYAPPFAEPSPRAIIPSTPYAGQNGGWGGNMPEATRFPGASPTEMQLKRNYGTMVNGSIPMQGFLPSHQPSFTSNPRPMFSGHLQNTTGTLGGFHASPFPGAWWFQNANPGQTSQEMPVMYPQNLR